MFLRCAFLVKETVTQISKLCEISKLHELELLKLPELPFPVKTNICMQVLFKNQHLLKLSR